MKMKMLRIGKIACLLICLLIFIYPEVVYGQGSSTIVSGKLIDEQTTEPIAFANVYVNGTTFGCQSNEKGLFTLRVPQTTSQIVISHLNFNTTAVDLQSNTSFVEVKLKRNVKALKEVVIGNVNYRLRNLQAFRTWFIGKDIWGTKAKILNDSVLVFEKTSDGLLATAKSPLLIDLPLLGYKLSVDLVNFQLIRDESNKTTQSSYVAYYYYIPVEYTNKKKIKEVYKARQEAYTCSSMHFFRSLFNDSLAVDGYAIYKERKIDNKIMYQPVKMDVAYFLDKNNEKILRIDGCKDSVFLICYYPSKDHPNVKKSDQPGYLVSKMYFTSDSCFVRSNGTLPDGSIMFDGAIGGKKVGAMLPENYSPFQ